MGWEQAGRGWGARALEWAYLTEPYARSANQALFDRLGVAVGPRYLDVACGSGFAASIASRRGADVAGLDASEALITIARARTPEADFRVGDMVDLPFADDSFDVVTSFNGIWKGCEQAIAEVHRILARSGRLGLTLKRFQDCRIDRDGPVVPGSPPRGPDRTFEAPGRGDMARFQPCSDG